jgi:hypothetical protein
MNMEGGPYLDIQYAYAEVHTVIPMGRYRFTYTTILNGKYRGSNMAIQWTLIEGPYLVILIGIRDPYKAIPVGRYRGPYMAIVMGRYRSPNRAILMVMYGGPDGQV